MRRLLRGPSLLAVLAIRGYQRSLGRLTGGRCRFHPTCSEYALQAIERRGLVVGAALAIWRLLRCGPWTAGGLDPVPGTHLEEGAARG